MIRVLLNIPSPALRAGLRALLSSDNSLQIINDSLDQDDPGSEADVVITSASPVLFSKHLPAINTNNGLHDSPSAAILFLSDEQVNLRELRRLSGTWGILPSDASAEELTAAVHALAQGLIVGTSTLLFES
ncbi:MAG TPA: hypothetical protein VFQ23_24620, partial [Anaerolineales bacterium]|nr:hypothetical protein [Anaerolineales bacterium]